MASSEHELEARILRALGGSKRGPLKPKELAREADFPPQEYRRLRRLLGRLERTGKVVRVKGHRFALASAIDVVTGVLAVTRNGDGFVRPTSGRADVFVPGALLATAMDGDRVVVRVERKPKGRSPEGRVLRVLERARSVVVGTFHRGRRVCYVSPLDPRLKRDVMVGAGEEGGASDGEVVVARLVSFGEGSVGPTATVERILGDLSDPGVDVLAVAYGFGLKLDFPPEVVDAALRAAESGMAAPGPHRTDRTGLLCFTIDPSDAKDHDDALSVAELQDGLVEVGVHIADVSHFVQPGDPIDAEAYSRGTSVYLVDRTVPMLPAVLSSDVCSLLPDTDRLAVSLFVELDRDARVRKRRYERTRIRCRYGLSYEEAQAVLDGTDSIAADVDAALRILDDRARSLRGRRRERGALDLDLPEAKVLLDDDGLPVDVQVRKRTESHRLIEDFMILANEVVAEDLVATGSGALFRVHEPPSSEKVEDLADLLSRFGLSVSHADRLRPRDVQALLDAVRGREEEALVSMAVLRSMKKARYDPESLGHFGLASTGYLHFTSPIRRYPDLVVHRAVVRRLVERRRDEEPDPELLAIVADQCSAREQAAEEAERASVALKKVELMEGHLGEDFPGRISGVAAFGFFVTLDEFFVEGLVHVSSLRDDFYHFQEKGYALVGDRGRRRYRLGDRVLVQVARVDKEARHVDFLLLRTLPRAD